MNLWALWVLVSVPSASPSRTRTFQSDILKLGPLPTPMLNSRSPLNARSLPIQEVREPLLSALGRQWRGAPNTTKDSGRRLGGLPIPFGRPLRVIQEFARQQVLRFPDLSDFARIGVSPATSLHVNSTRITERVF